VLVYPWCEGSVLNAATTSGSDRTALRAFQQLPVHQVNVALTDVLDAHLAVAAAGFVAVDLYDGCFLYDPDAPAMRLIDLDEYRPGPFVVEGDRLPGSLRYLAPEALVSGATIDERTTVFELGRTILHLLSDPDGRWRGTAEQLALVAAATPPDPADRLPTVAALVAGWRGALPRGHR
jgi:serine/threonine-protein kinase